MLKIRKPNQAPAKLICQYNGVYGVPHPTQQPQPQANQWERMSENAKSTAASTNSSQQARYSARFVKENPHDKYEVVSGASFSKTWWMRNDGEVAWPTGTQLVQTSGDNISAAIYTCHNPIGAGETVEMTVACKAPEKEGRYTAFFRLQTGRIKFGHKVSCDILVVPMPPVQEPEPAREDLEARINNIFSQPV